jgi:serine/threonine protein kinase
MVEFFETDMKFYLVFELIHGGSLEARIEEVGRQIAEAQVKSLVHSIASALDFLHGRGIAHRDIKPANILLPDPLSLDGAKLCDFDLASRAKTANEVRGDITMTSPVGSAEFMAPEVVRAFCAMDDERVKYDQKCDMWSLGVITYSLLAGRPPFEGKCDSKCGWDDGEPCDECQDSLFAAIQQGQLEFPEAIFRQCSPEVINLISRCLSKDASMRPTPAEVLRHPWFAEADLRRLSQIKPNVPTAALQNEVITRA